MRVVVDTNVVVSSFISPTGPPDLVLQRWLEQKYDLVVSRDVLNEYARVLRYLHVQRLTGLDEREVQEQIGRFRQYGVMVEPADVPRVVLDDPKDDMFIAAAVAGEAAYIVSGDHHLLDLGSWQGIHILSPATFLTLLDTAPDML